MPQELGFELAAEVERRFYERLRRRNKPVSTPTNRASSIGDACLRKLVLERTKGEEKAPVPDGLLAIFNYGHMIEGPVRRLVEDLGFEVTHAQWSFPKNDFNLSGHIDGMIEHPTEKISFILEIKGINGSDWSKVKTWQDIRDYAKPWLAKYFDQAQLYTAMKARGAWGEDFEVGGILYVLFNKWTGELRPVFAPLEIVAAEALLDKSLKIEEHVAAGTLPDYVEDRTECAHCGFYGRACHPTLAFEGSGVQEISDPAVVEALRIVTEEEREWQAYESAWKLLFGPEGKLRGVEIAVVSGGGGPGFRVTGKWSPSTSYPVPEDVKAPFKKVNPKGTWRPRISAIQEEEARRE